MQVQFRYAYVVRRGGHEGARRDRPGEAGAGVADPHAGGVHSIYLARTYAYVAAGKQGLVILDITNAGRAEGRPGVTTPAGCINDVHDVKLGITYVSEFAYVADGKNGLRVVQLTSPGDAGQRRLQPAADAAPGRDVQAPARRARRCRSRRAWTATGRWTRAATRSACSAGSARGR